MNNISLPQHHMPNHINSFINRKSDAHKLFRTILGELERTQCWAIVGQRDIGKTCFVQHLAEPTTSQALGYANAQHFFIYFDCQLHAVALHSIETFFQKLCGHLQQILPAEIYRSIASYEQHVSSPRSWLDEWNRLIQGCQNQNIYVIWIFDHFESAVRQEALLREGAFGILRGHAQRPHFAYITCTNHSLHVLFEEAFSDYNISSTRRAEASDFFNITLEHPLELFGSNSDIDQIIAVQAVTLQVSFSAAEIASIKRFGGRFPFYIQRACEQFSNAKKTDQTSIQSIERDCLSFATPRWERYWTKLKPSQRDVLLAVAQGASVTNLRELYFLAARALIYLDRGRYKPFSEMFGEYILQQFSRSQPDRVLDASVKKASEAVLFNDPIIIAKKRRLRALELRAAQDGRATSPEITIEIEDLHNELAKLEKEAESGRWPSS